MRTFRVHSFFLGRNNFEVMRKNRAVALVAMSAALVAAHAQTDPKQLTPLLGERLLPPEVSSIQLRQYLMRKVPGMPVVASAADWTEQARKLRQKILAEFVYRGWPRQWIDMPVKVEDLGVIPSGPGYRMRKLRYEVVPDFYATAILYEPEKLVGKVPAIINTNGHVGAPGKAIEYKQKRCINQALQGMIALNLEWPGVGELSQPGNAHFFYAHLDLVGSSGLGLFYMVVRKALDYLCAHPHVDPKRIGMTGLSGGGFQTILLSSLDERVRVAVPVAGFASVISRIERTTDTGDIEHHARGMLAVADYPLLVALRAPRPTLLIYNAEDSCCYRAPLVKPYIFDRVRPFFRLYGAEDNLLWYQHVELPIHNYQLDNRQQAYGFFTRHFNMPVAKVEIPVDSQIKSPDELVVGLPENALTIIGVARRLAENIQRHGTPASGPARTEWLAAKRSELKNTISYQPVAVEHAWPLGNTHGKGLETVSYRFDFANNLSAAAVWLKALSAPATAPVTVVLNDQGKKSAGELVSDRINRGEQVVAADLLFTGDSIPGTQRTRGNYIFAQLLTGLGESALGLEAAQLISISRWAQNQKASPRGKVRIETDGMRSQVLALVAGSIEPGLFSEIAIHGGISSLRHLLDKPVPFPDASDLFCFGLLKEFDLDPLRELSAPARIVHARQPLAHE